MGVRRVRGLMGLAERREERGVGGGWGVCEAKPEHPTAVGAGPANTPRVCIEGWRVCRAV